MSNRKKIAILADPLDRQSAGIYVYLKMLSLGLSELGEFEYHLIRNGRKKTNYGLQNIYIPSAGFPGSILYRKWVQIPIFIRKNNYDAVIEPAHFGPFNLPDRIKRITIIHDLTPILYPEYHPNYSSISQRLFLPRIIQKSNLIITNSQNTRKDVVEHYPVAIDKTEFIYPAINPIFKPVKSRKHLDKIGLNVPYFLSVGTIEPRKNYHAVLSAFELFKSNNKKGQHKLIIVGRKGWHYNSFLKRVQNSPYKDFIQLIHDVHTDNLPEFYSHATAFIYASKYEGYGFPLIEAYNCGAYCIAAKNSSLNEIGASFAHYFHTDNSIELSSLMEKAVTQKEQNIEKSTARIYNPDFALKFNSLVKRTLLG